MTSEVAVMNRRALAMAADSAATVTKWIRGEPRRRFYKGANKIFQLSASEPVGVMIYGSAGLQGVPWEVLVKSFRADRDKATHEYLVDYGDDLFRWIEGNKHAFPDEFREMQFANEALESASRVALPAIKAAIDEEDENQKHARLAEEFDRVEASVRADLFLANADQLDVERGLQMRERVAELIVQNNYLAITANVVGADRLANVAIEAVVKKSFSSLEQTGVVIGGFGRNDYFPSLVSYACYGNIFDKCILSKEEENCRSIGQGNVSEIVPFARAEMIRTFMYGIGIRGLVEIDELLGKALDAFERGLRNNGGLAEENVDDLKAQVSEQFSTSLTDYFRTNHSDKLREVIGQLPVEDIAELAETLVLTESLKERVTTDDETVGGPIDVAVISKNDGFVWIKRKHYFEAELNPRYFTRIKM